MDDRSQTVASVHNASRVYLVINQNPVLSGIQLPWVAVSEDGGRTFSNYTEIGPRWPNTTTGAVPTITALASGRLVVAYLLTVNNPFVNGFVGVLSHYSDDGAATWSAPALVAAAGAGGTDRDRYADHRTVLCNGANETRGARGTGTSIVGLITASTAGAYASSVYFVGEMGYDPAPFTTYLFHSADAGVSWGAGVPVSPLFASRARVFQASVTTDPRTGYVGVLFYDTRYDVPEDEAFTVDAWFAEFSPDLSHRLSETRLTCDGSLDFRDAARVGTGATQYNFVGDYTTVAHNGTHYVLAYVAPIPNAAQDAVCFSTNMSNGCNLNRTSFRVDDVQQVLRFAAVAPDLHAKAPLDLAPYTHYGGSAGPLPPSANGTGVDTGSGAVADGGDGEEEGGGRGDGEDPDYAGYD
jgi:hypothetical protein